MTPKYNQKCSYQQEMTAMVYSRQTFVQKCILIPDMTEYVEGI